MGHNPSLYTPGVLSASSRESEIVERSIMSVVLVLLDAGADKVTSFLYLGCGLCCVSILVEVEAKMRMQARC